MIIEIMKKTENGNRQLLQTCMPESFIIDYKTKKIKVYFPDKPATCEFDKVVTDWQKEIITVIL